MRIKLIVMLACASALLTACWDDGDDAPVAATPPVTEAVPAEASTSPDAATVYVTALTAVPAATSDTLEPVNPVPDTLATDDTAEPKAVE